jgi:hypothetical protein
MSKTLAVWVDVQLLHAIQYTFIDISMLPQCRNVLHVVLAMLLQVLNSDACTPRSAAAAQLMHQAAASLRCRATSTS